MDGDAQVRARIMGHWQASEQGDSAAEHAIYAADAVLDYPQSGERCRGYATIAAQVRPHGVAAGFLPWLGTATADTPCAQDTRRSRYHAVAAAARLAAQDDPASRADLHTHAVVFDARAWLVKSEHHRRYAGVIG